MPGGAPKGSANAFKYGKYQLQRLLSDGGPKKSTALYHVIAAKEQELIASLGGDPSPQELAIIKDTIKTQLYKGSIDRYLMGLKSLVRKGRLHGVLAERTRLAAHERDNLRTLGLKRVAKAVDWRDALRDSTGTEDNGKPEPGDSEGK
jgi:hypothetical protein